jgi:glycerophosphoryl diester phosphodiesterase
VLVSAHRGGAGRDVALENTRTAIERALALGVDYVELDVRRLGDGRLVLVHDDWVLVDGERRALGEVSYEQFVARAPHFLGLEDALELLAGRAGAHLDLKFRSPVAAYSDPDGPGEIDAVSLAVEALGPEQVVVTTGNARAIRAVRDWSDARGLPLRAGITVGGSVAGRSLRRQVGQRRMELAPGPLVERSRANAVVAHQALAFATVARFARRAGLPLLVWTVDDPVSLRYWLRPGAAWMVTTNVPGRAMGIRERLSGRRPAPR